MENRAADMKTETEARGGCPHTEAELVAENGGSDRRRVKLCVTNVYSGNASEVVELEASRTVADLKGVLEDAFDGRPAPHQQRLIFRGKQCEDTQQLGDVLRGLDLSSRLMMHLVVTQPAAHQSQSPATLEHSRPRAPCPTGDRSGGTGNTLSQPPGANGLTEALRAPVAPRSPDRVELSKAQIQQLQLRYRQALRESQEALQWHQQHHQFLSTQYTALEQRRAHSSAAFPRARSAAPSSPSSAWRPSTALASEVATTVATRALGGNMPGPAAGGAVRDVTGEPPQDFIPPAGLLEDGTEGRGNLVDPPTWGPEARQVARSYMKLLLQCIGVIFVFGFDVEGWLLIALAIGGLVAALFRTGLLEVMLGGGHDGGLWKALCRGATVITQGGGALTDVRLLCTTFFFSLFPTWKPARSPEAIAAEAAAQDAAQDAARAAEAAAAAQPRAEAFAEVHGPDLTARGSGAQTAGQETTNDQSGMGAAATNAEVD